MYSVYLPFSLGFYHYKMSFLESVLSKILFHFICIKIDFHKKQYLDIYCHNLQQMIGFGGSQSGNMFLEKTGTE